MPRENRTRYAVLGMLASGKQSGYDLKQNFQRRMGHFWAESPGQIYPMLRKLREEGLISSTVERQDGRPDRAIHAITAEGRRVLREWLEEPAAPDRLRKELNLKLFFGPEVGLETALQHIERYEETQRQTLGLYESFEDEIRAVARNDDEEFFWLLTLMSGRYVSDARLEWCKKAKRSIRARMRRENAAGGRT